MSEPLIAAALPHHFCISVADLEASIEWWRSLFGFELEFTFDIPPIKARGAFIRKQAMRIEIFEIAGSAPAPASRFRPDTDLHVQGVKHFCFAVDDVQAALETVYRAGVTIAGIARGVGKPMLAEGDPTLRDGMAPASAFFITDPWGCLVEVLATNDFAP